MKPVEQEVNLPAKFLPQSEYPGDLCCTLYDGKWLNESRLTICLDQDTEFQKFDLAELDFDDKTESWWCGKSVLYQFCMNDHLQLDERRMQCVSGAGSGRDVDIRSKKNSFENQLSYAGLWLYDPTKQGALTLFEDVDCQGTSAVFLPGKDMNQKVSYSYYDLQNTSVPAYSASSMMIPYGLSVNMYQGGGFQGDVLTKDGLFFTDENLSHACVNLKDEKFDNLLGSMEIYKTGYLGAAARGYW